MGGQRAEEVSLELFTKDKGKKWTREIAGTEIKGMEVKKKKKKKGREEKKHGREGGRKEGVSREAPGKQTRETEITESPGEPRAGVPTSRP